VGCGCELDGDAAADAAARVSRIAVTPPRPRKRGGSCVEDLADGEWGQIGKRSRSQRQVAFARRCPSAPLLRLTVVVVVAVQLAFMPAPARAQIRQRGDPQWRGRKGQAEQLVVA